MREPQALGAELERLLAHGFRAFKIGWGPFGRQSHRVDEAIVAGAREIVGPDVELTAAAGARAARPWPGGPPACSPPTASRGLRRPLGPDHVADHAELRRTARTRSPAARCSRAASASPWFRARALDLVQPDVTKVGGRSEQRRIAWAAADAGVRFFGHGCNTAIGPAADRQRAGALPGADLVEYCAGSRDMALRTSW
jgi:D-galactarolactone cycloisomerase